MVAFGSLVLFLVGAGCGNGQQDIVDSQRAQIDELTQKVNDLSEAAKPADVAKQTEKQNPPKAAPVAPKPADRPVVDPAIKIEKCRTQAKDYADNLAKQAYLSAYQTAMDNGNTETAIYLLNLSAKPEHPADYDGNYDFAYLKCLDN